MKPSTSQIEREAMIEVEQEARLLFQQGRLIDAASLLTKYDLDLPYVLVKALGGN